MKRILAAAVVVLMTAGCGRSLVQDFRSGFPTKDMVEVKTPASSSLKEGGDLATSYSALQGERANSYSLTRGATVTINTGTLWVLGLVKAITDQQPTTVEQDKAIWGPGSDALDPNIYKMTATRDPNSDDSFSYALEAKPKSAADSAYVVILSGHHVRTSDAHGSGSFLVDWDAAQTLVDHDPNAVGTATVDYSREDGTNNVTVSAEFDNVNDGNGGRQDLSYRYAKAPGADGSFEFKAFQNIDSDPSRSMPEKWTVHSRWNETGAGRADYQVSEGNLTSPVTGNECWDTSFNSSMVIASWDPSQNYGSEATDCSTFTSASYSDL